MGKCKTGRIHHNLVRNSTDVGIVAGGNGGGTTGCEVDNNTITQTIEHAFAGMHFGHFDPGQGNMTGASFHNNSVNATGISGEMDFGIVIGPHPWNPGLCTFGGSVTNNTINGGYFNLAVDGYSNGSVTGNTLTNPHAGCHCLFPNCGATPDHYVAGDYTNVTLTPNYGAGGVQINPVSRIFHNGTSTGFCCIPGAGCTGINCP